MLWNQLPDNLTWIDKLRYYLEKDPEEVNNKDLKDALCVLTAMYIDEYESNCALEEAIVSEIGEDRFEELLDSTIGDETIWHYSRILSEPRDNQRICLALGFLDKLGNGTD